MNSRKIELEMSALVTSEIFRLFLNTLTPYDTSIPVAICGLSDNNFKTPLSQKGNAFFGFLIAFLKCAWKLEHSEEKEKYPSLIITKIIGSERDVYLSV